MEHYRILRALFQLILLWIPFQSTSCVEFDRELTGVAYSAFVHRSENGQPIPGWDTLTLQNIKTMLEVISTKFTRVATYGVGAKNVLYVKNDTYYGGKQGFTAEAAALINQERMNLSTTVIVGMWLSDEDVQMESEIEVALETAEIGNNIYNGTVVGLVASHNEIGNKDKLERTKQALDVITKIKVRAHAVGLKVGTRQSCYEKKGETGELLKKIVNMSDFIICEMQPAQDQSISGGKAGFETVGNDLLVNKHLLKRINPNIEVMGQTGWPSKGKEPWQTIDNLKIYWETANEWAVKNNFTMWFTEAFDGPWKNWDPHSAHFGWWKLRQNKDINNPDGYAEKIYEPPEVEPKVGTNPWIIVGVALAVAFIVLIMALFTLLFMRVQKLQQAITPEDIREFMEGLSAETAQSGQMENALMVPYDKSYEISKDKLQIKLCPLGSLEDYLRNNQISNTTTADRYANAPLVKLDEAETNMDKPPITYRDMVQWSHEIACGDIPYPGLSWNLDFVDSLVNGLRMKSPPHATPEVYNIMVDCWHLEPNERPTFTDLKSSTGHLFEPGTEEGNNPNPTENIYANQPQPSSTVYTEIEL
ncbi:unnamed protein product [Orchesella dallaii]|uniref:Tyrosine-protein kinase catalytic domain-containing protein n=1 Tax=Orchesella dallaii TaxID=48710 RepID=A0ABP1R365_9HEXA